MKTWRAIPHTAPGALYLTFDDGPDPKSTEAVLSLLSQLNVRATFFCVAQKAQSNLQILRETARLGHTLGNHSLDHGYSRFFCGRRALETWIRDAEALLQDLWGQPTIGFRPPAGIVTPELHRALKNLEMPLVLWNTRFFDTARTWTLATAQRSLARAHSGDIILLHDCQKEQRLSTFLETLRAYVNSAQEAGYRFEAIQHSDLRPLA